MRILDLVNKSVIYDEVALNLESSRMRILELVEASLVKYRLYIKYSLDYN